MNIYFSTELWDSRILFITPIHRRDTNGASKNLLTCCKPNSGALSAFFSVYYATPKKFWARPEIVWHFKQL